MKRIKAWSVLHSMWDAATPEQKEALGVAMDDIEFVDLMHGDGLTLTNAQHLRSRTDEELANFLLVHQQEACYALAKTFGAEAPDPKTIYPSDYEKKLNWLKQPYKEEA